MPYKSRAQAGYFHTHKAQLEAQGVDVAEWDKSSKGKSLPYKVKKTAMKTARRYGGRAEGGPVFDERPDEVLGRAGKAAIDYVKDAVDPWKKDESGKYYADQPLASPYGKTPEIRKGAADYAQTAIDVGSNFIPMGGGPAKSIFLGPLATKALRATMQMHPAVGSALTAAEQAILRRAAENGPEAVTAARRGIQNNRDAIAAIDLKNNPAADPERDRLRFALTGTARNAAEQPVKEASDLGVGLKPIGADSESWRFKIMHPEGDLHEALGIPAVKFDSKMNPGEAATNRKTNEITLGGMPWVKSHMQKALGALVHELDHVAGLKDNMPIGSSPAIEPIFPQMYHQGLGKEAPSDSEQVMKAFAAQNFGMRALPDSERTAAFDTYRRSAGEVSAENARGRRAKGYKYLSYPEDTEHTGRGQQIIRFDRDFDKRAEEVNKADGGALSDMGQAASSYFDPDKLTQEQKYQLGVALLKKQLLAKPPTDDVANDPFSKLMSPFDDGPTVQQQERDYQRLDAPNANRLHDLEGTMEDNLQKPWGDGRAMKNTFPIAMAGGGNPYAPKQQKASDISGYMSRKMIHKAVSPGMLKSQVPGRTDKLPISVPAGSYVVPADIVSGLGQGNSDAGNAILSKMFKSGPLGMKAAVGPHTGQASKLKTGFLSKGSKSSALAAGGATDQVPVIAAGGEYILHPEQVMEVGGGDIDRGHEVLDHFVKHTRKHLIKTLRKLPGPARD